MIIIENLGEQKKLEVAGKLLGFLEKEIPGDQYGLADRLEVLMLAYHASTNTRELRCLISSI